MKLTVVSFKECWQDQNGKWYSFNGFPLQMVAIGRLFDQMKLVIVQVPQRPGGIPLPENAEVIPLRKPKGEDNPRKLSVLFNLPYYLGTIMQHTRDADVVHVPVPGDISLLGMIAGLLQGKRTIIRYCGSWADNANTTWVNSLTKWAMRTFAGERNVMLATGVIKPVPPAPHMKWVNTTALSSEEIRESHPELDRGLQEPPRLVFIGRLATEKGVHYLLRALARLRAEHFEPFPTLTLIGDGFQRAQYEALAQELNLAGFVNFVGQVNRQELIRRLGEQDLCVQPTLSEGLGKAWLDAMAYGLPVLTTTVGAAEDIFTTQGEIGWVIPPRDETALVNALREVLSSPRDWPAMRKRCRAYAESQSIESWAALIGQICASQWNIPFESGKLAA